MSLQINGWLVGGDGGRLVQYDEKEVNVSERESVRRSVNHSQCSTVEEVKEEEEEKVATRAMQCRQSLTRWGYYSKTLLLLLTDRQIKIVAVLLVVVAVGAGWLTRHTHTVLKAKNTEVKNTLRSGRCGREVGTSGTNTQTHNNKIGTP